MASTHVEAEILASARDVWAILGDFAGIKPDGVILSCEISGDGVDMVRTFKLANGTVQERLDAHDDEKFYLSYSVVNDDSPLPLDDYSASIQVTEITSGTCRVDWRGDYSPRNITEAMANEIVSGIYSSMINSTKRQLEVVAES